MRLAPCFTRVWCQSLMTQQWIAVRLRDLQLYCIHLCLHQICYWSCFCLKASVHSWIDLGLISYTVRVLSWNILSQYTIYAPGERQTRSAWCTKSLTVLLMQTLLQVCWRSETLAPGGTNSNSKSSIPEKIHTCIITSNRQFNSGTLYPQVLHEWWLYPSSDLHWRVGWKAMPNHYQDQWFFNLFFSLPLMEHILTSF